MAAAVIFHWSLPEPWQNPHAAKKAFIRWSHTCKAFGVVDLCMIDVDDLRYDFGDREIKLTRVRSLGDALAQFPALTPVYVESGPGAVDIRDFRFPEHPLFIYGDDFGELPRADLEIVTNNPLTAEVCNGIVLAWWRHGT